VLKDILYKVIAGAIVWLLAAGASLLSKSVRRLFKDIILLRKAGIKFVLPRDEYEKKEVFKKAIREGGGNDELLIVGRTNRSFVHDYEKDLLSGLANGLNVSEVLLEPEEIDKGIDLSQLQLADPLQIKNDLKSSIDAHKLLFAKAKEGGLAGTFLVCTCDHVVFNSLAAFRNTTQTRVALDFSFRDKFGGSRKYVLYFECDRRDPDHFCNQLYEFYRGFYDPERFYLGYRDKRIEYGLGYAKSEIRADVDALVREYSASEESRNNDPSRLLPYVPSVFGTIKGGEINSGPISVQIEVTNQCNGQCVHCSRHNWNSDGAKADSEMATEELKSLLNDLWTLRVKSVTFSGGEPTCRTDLPDILEYAHWKRLGIGVLTNGLDIDDNMATALAKYSTWIRISLDGSEPATYDRVRVVKSGFARVKGSLERINEAKMRVRSECRIGLSYTIQRSNIEDVPRMINMALNSPLFQNLPLVFKFAHGQNGGIFRCTVPELRALYKDILEGRPARDNTNLDYLKQSIDRRFTPFDDIAKGKPLGAFYRREKTTCFTPYLFSLVDSTGDVYPCCFLYHDNDPYMKFQPRRQIHKLGNVRHVRFGDIWSGDSYTEKRKSLGGIDLAVYPECAECTRHYFHNAFLTRLLSAYDAYERKYGAIRDAAFHDVVDKYPEEVLWL
jgi:MoaA/NifB/PqqE/SkfB family radical SAM enzyme